MFLREIKAGGNTYLNIVETYRVKGKVRHKYIASLGRLDDEVKGEQLKRIALKLLEYYDKNKTILDVSSAEERERKIWGGVKVYRKIWDYFGFDKIFKKILRGRKIEFDFFSATFLMLLDRLLGPKSKLKSYEEQERYYGIEENDLQHLYRALDVLADNKEIIEQELFHKNRSLFNIGVDVVLYDVTTLYFDSSRVDSLRDFGFSKDCKINNVQILLGLLTDLDGRPVGFDIFPGNTFEGHTLEDAIKKINDRFNINRLIIICDQAMLSKDNLKLLQEAGYQYIVGSRIKNRSKSLKEKILEIEKYSELLKTEDETVLYRELDLAGDRLICTWSSARARKDKAIRERLLAKAEKIIYQGKGSVINKRGASRYIKLETQGTPSLNEDKIIEDTRWDGFFGIQTNCKNLSHSTILSYYKDLWRIEESFRIFKSHLETRPIFHWTPKRIKGHMVLCFIAFMLERTLELELRNNKIEYSPEKIRKALNDLQFSTIQIENKTFYLRSNVEGLANDILRLLKIRIPPKISDSLTF